ncbi:hypothetical protein LDVICp103 [lymphocystis disease virus-China]|uniref:Uncharacterized protein n=1 Tax=lymphocystis disease virus-China TaxID=256729 RepID=Q678A9_9VIRU|nr:hypothetical protein LDVICp103 [lymphocystis disease virus-China]AAU10948.1 hypothetical protein [lymphocystis disease virus-China]
MVKMNLHVFLHYHPNHNLGLFFYLDLVKNKVHIDLAFDPIYLLNQNN